MGLYEKLLKIQTELKAPKNLKNNFGGYSYRSAEGILESVKPLNSKYGVCLTIDDEIVLIGDRYYVKSTAKAIDIESGEMVQAVAYAREELNKKGMDSSQLTGSTSSYARKYALNGLYAIDDNKDADFLNNGSEEKKSPQKKESNGTDYLITDKQKRYLFSVASKCGFNEQQIKMVIKSSYGLDSIKELTKSKMDELIKRMENKNK